MHLYWHWGVWLSNGHIAEFRWLLSSFLSNPGKGHHSYRVRGRRCERVTVLVQEGRSKKVRTCAVARERGTRERHFLLFGIVQPWTAQLPAEPVQSQKHTPISAISAEIQSPTTHSSNTVFIPHCHWVWWTNKQKLSLLGSNPCLGFTPALGLCFVCCSATNYVLADERHIQNFNGKQLRFHFVRKSNPEDKW